MYDLRHFWGNSPGDRLGFDMVVDFQIGWAPMSIVARICGITGREKVWKLVLEPYCDDAVGQDTLRIANPPENYASLGILLGMKIWGGCSDIMCGERKLADRLSVVTIELSDDWYHIAQYREPDF